MTLDIKVGAFPVDGLGWLVVIGKGKLGMIYRVCSGDDAAKNERRAKRLGRELAEFLGMEFGEPHDVRHS